MDTESESIAFDAIRQYGGFSLYKISESSIPGLGAVRICTQNPQRQALYIWSSDTGNSIYLSPTRPTLIAVDATKTHQLPIVIHAAVYPLLCQGEWWIVPQNTSIISVYELQQSA